MAYSYERSWEIQAAHFNGSRAYVDWAEAVKACQLGDYAEACERLKSCLSDLHGHNFHITVSADADDVDVNGFVIDDLQVTAIVESWQNTNLSVHPDFLYENSKTKQRATTEAMARILHDKLKSAFPFVTFVVSVRENRDIAAFYSDV